MYYSSHATSFAPLLSTHWKIDKSVVYSQRCSRVPMAPAVCMQPGTELLFQVHQPAQHGRASSQLLPALISVQKKPSRRARSAPETRMRDTRASNSRPGSASNTFVCGTATLQSLYKATQQIVVPMPHHQQLAHQRCHITLAMPQHPCSCPPGPR